MSRKPVKITRSDELETEISSGDMTRLAGVSAATTGAEGIHLAIATLAPGCSSAAHYHTNCESAIYVAQGRGLFMSGDDLSVKHEIGQGDFIHVPEGAPHKPINTSTTEPLVLVVARNTPVELVVNLD